MPEPEGVRPAEADYALGRLDRALADIEALYSDFVVDSAQDRDVRKSRLRKAEYARKLSGPKDFLREYLRSDSVAAALRTKPGAAAIFGIRVNAVPNLVPALRVFGRNTPGLKVALSATDSSVFEAKHRAYQLSELLDELWKLPPSERAPEARWMAANPEERGSHLIAADIKVVLWGKDRDIVNVWTVAAAIGRMRPSGEGRRLAARLPQHYVYQELAEDGATESLLRYFDATLARLRPTLGKPVGPDAPGLG